jgi:hypothetical protein
MPTAFGRQLLFNPTYEEPRGESKEEEVSKNKECIPIKFQDNSPSVKKCNIPVDGAKHALWEETSDKIT